MAANFSFVIDGELAGMACPGRFAHLRDDLAYLRRQGVGAIVSLTEYPLDHRTVEAFGFQYMHLPIPDYHPPTVEQVWTFLRFMERQRELGAVMVHCAAGQGRTGTMLACALVHRGVPAEEAIRTVRRLRPPSIDTDSQEAFVHTFMHACGNGNGHPAAGA
jgi:atypical dual specificity phosphatase